MDFLYSYVFPTTSKSNENEDEILENPEDLPEVKPILECTSINNAPIDQKTGGDTSTSNGKKDDLEKPEKLLEMKPTVESTANTPFSLETCGVNIVPNGSQDNNLENPEELPKRIPTEESSANNNSRSSSQEKISETSTSNGNEVDNFEEPGEIPNEITIMKSSTNSNIETSFPNIWNKTNISDGKEDNDLEKLEESPKGVPPVECNAINNIAPSSQDKVSEARTFDGNEDANLEKTEKNPKGITTVESTANINNRSISQETCGVISVPYGNKGDTSEKPIELPKEMSTVESRANNNAASSSQETISETSTSNENKDDNLKKPEEVPKGIPPVESNAINNIASSSQDKVSEARTFDGNEDDNLEKKEKKPKGLTTVESTENINNTSFSQQTCGVKSVPYGKKGNTAEKPKELPIEISTVESRANKNAASSSQETISETSSTANENKDDNLKKPEEVPKGIPTIESTPTSNSETSSPKAWGGTSISKRKKNNNLEKSEGLPKMKPGQEINTDNDIPKNSQMSHMTRGYEALVYQDVKLSATGNNHLYKKFKAAKKQISDYIKRPNNVESQIKFYPKVQSVISCFKGSEEYKRVKLQTLGDALLFFGFYYILDELDRSLEDLRKYIKTENDHENNFKKILKKILLLSNKYHPDKVENRGGTESDLAIGTTFQTAINSIRTVLKYLNRSFLKDIRTDHKFQFYTQLNINSLSNENEIENRIFEMKLKICVMSKIKQKNIIFQIRNFLIESKRCVACYLECNLHEFDELGYLALSHLNFSIEGYEKLCEEINEIQKKCRIKNEEYILYVLQNMEKDSKRDLKMLKLLEEIVNSSLEGNYHFFSTEEFMDPYLVSPFVWYTNVIIMCSIMVSDVSLLKNLNVSVLSSWKFNDELSDLQPLYDLVVSYLKFIYNKDIYIQQFYNSDIMEAQLKSEFWETLKKLKENMEVKFNVDHYSEVMVADILSLKLDKCMMMMKEFEEKAEELSNNFEDVHKKSEKMEEKLEEIQNFKQMSDEINKETMEMLEENKRFSELASSILSNLL